MPAPQLKILWSSLNVTDRGPALRYGMAVALFVIGLVIRMAFNVLFPPGYPFLTFFPAVIVATFLAGRGAGILCAILSGLGAWFFFIPPQWSFALDGQVATAMIFYSGVVTVDILLIDGLLKRQRQLEESQVRMREMADYQSLLFKELQHRVANNLASVASMLRLQRRQIERDPTTALALIDRADERIELMGRVHRQLYDPAAQTLRLQDHLANAVEQAKDVSGAQHIAVRLVVDDVRVEVGRLLTLVLLLTELLTNSFKHAFEPGQHGVVDVRLEQAEGSMLCLTVADNGRGLATDDATGRAGADVAVGVRRRSLGSAIIAGLVAQLGGISHTRNRNGVTTTVMFPQVWRDAG